MKHKQLSPEELDVVVVRALARLPLAGPSRGFAGRVMDRVQLPPARALVLFQRARAWASQPRRVVALTGTYAVLAAITMVVVVPWVAANRTSIGFALDWAAGRFLGLMREAGMAIATWTVNSGVADAVQSLPLSGTSAWVAGGVLTAAYAGCAIGLHYLLRVPGGKHEAVKLPA